MKTNNVKQSTLKHIFSGLALFLLFAAAPRMAHAQTGPAGVNNGILTWLDASDVDADGNPANNPAGNTAITTWNDKSGNGKNATQLSGLNAGVYNTSGINGFPTVKFSGSHVYTFLGIDIRAVTLPDVTVIVVYQSGSVNRSGIWGNDDGGWDRFVYTRFDSQNGAISIGPVSPLWMNIAGSGIANSVNILTSIYDGQVNSGTNSGPTNGSSCYLNGSLVGTFTDVSNASAAMTTLRLGWDGDDGRFNGDIAEFLVYNRKLNACELSAINGYLSAKYNISLTAAAPAPNIKTGNTVINTQTEMDAFFNAGNGKKWTKIEGDLTLNGNSSTDPITSLCNLNELSEITGYLLIQQFTKPSNPKHLYDLSSLSRAGRLTVITCPQLQSAVFPGVTEITGSLNIRNNRYLMWIHFPKLHTVGGEMLMFARNHRLKSLKLSDKAASFSLTHAGNAKVDIQSNGDSTSSALTMDFNKLTAASSNFTFSNNSNSGVVNFDQIFGNLTSIGGNMVITGNSYLNKCCVAYSTSVTGSVTISGNSGNCADITAVTADCGAFAKRQGHKAPQKRNADLFANLTLYPNPGSGAFEIGLTTLQTGRLNITVSDLLGRAVLSQTAEVAGTMSIPVNAENRLAEGQYLVKLELNGQVIVKRLQIVK